MIEVNKVEELSEWWYFSIWPKNVVRECDAINIYVTKVPLDLFSVSINTITQVDKIPSLNQLMWMRVCPPMIL